MYVIPFMPGGSKFMRNPPPPMSVCFPDGNLPADAPQYEVNPDMTVAKPETGRNAVGTVLVDFYKKNASIFALVAFPCFTTCLDSILTFLNLLQMS